MNFYAQPGRDGRRRSNPLQSLDGAPAKAPDWQLSRVVTAQDAVFTKRGDGVNSSSYEHIRFAVTPMDADPTEDPAAIQGGSANPNVQVRVWSEQADAFIPLPTDLTKSGVGVGVGYVIDVDNARGSIVGCFVTNDPAGEFVAIFSQGFAKDP